jgi:hypothetical protein
MELPNAPFYRRWSFLLAAVIGLAAIAAMLGWRGFQQVASPSTTTTTVPSTSTVAPTTTTTTPPTSSTATSRPAEVLWEAEGSDAQGLKSRGFEAPAGWRIEWEFDCGNFRKFGGGNFKITGDGAFARIQIQEFDIEASGRRSFTRGGYGHLLVDSVCEHWKITALAG